MVVLKPVDFKERTPVKAGRYLIQLYGGHICVKRWIPRSLEFSRMENPLIEKWYKEVILPDPNDLHFIMDDKVPKHLHFRERELILQGARMAAEYLHELLGKS